MGDTGDEREGDNADSPASDPHAAAPDGRPNPAQRRYLSRALTQPGGKLPLFDLDGQAIAPQVVRSCLKRGWAEPWFNNAMKPDWLVCKLTESGRRLAAES